MRFGKAITLNLAKNIIADISFAKTDLKSPAPGIAVEILFAYLGEKIGTQSPID